MRIVGLADWQSRWFSQKNFQGFLKQDVVLRAFILKKLGRIGLGSIEIERSFNAIKVILKTAKPGLIIGRGGAGVEQLKKEIDAALRKADPKIKIPQVLLEIEEIKQPQSHAAVMASSIAEQIEKRMPFRRLLKQSLEKIAATKGVEGVKIVIKGRLDGNEIARKEWLAKGRLPLHTLRADIDYARDTAFTTYGTIGIKVWIHKGERKEEKTIIKNKD